MRKFGFEVLGMGTNSSGYPGAFTKPLIDIIQAHITGDILHLFSGSSLIGNERMVRKIND